MKRNNKGPKIIIQAQGFANGSPCNFRLGYLEWMSINSPAIMALAGWTRDINKAMVFPNIEAATAAWRSERTVMSNDPRDKMGGRSIPDGKPNRPLTAISVKYIPVEVSRGRK